MNQGLLQSVETGHNRLWRDFLAGGSNPSLVVEKARDFVKSWLARGREISDLAVRARIRDVCSYWNFLALDAEFSIDLGDLPENATGAANLPTDRADFPVQRRQRHGESQLLAKESIDYSPPEGWARKPITSEFDQRYSFWERIYGPDQKFCI